MVVSITCSRFHSIYCQDQSSASAIRTSSSSDPALRGSLDLVGAAACRAAVVAPLSALTRHVAATQPLRPGAVQLAAVSPEVCSAAGVGAQPLLATVLWTTRTRLPLLVRSAQPLQVVSSASRHTCCTSQSIFKHVTHGML